MVLSACLSGAVDERRMDRHLPVTVSVLLQLQLLQVSLATLVENSLKEVAQF